MLPMFHLFCRKQHQYDAEISKIKAVKVAEIIESKPPQFLLDIEYKDGTTAIGKYENVHTMHDKYASFLPAKLVRELHDLLKQKELWIRRNDKDLPSSATCTRKSPETYTVGDELPIPGSYRSCRCR